MTDEIFTRKELADKLELVMNKAYDRLKEEMQLERNMSLVKSYLLEAHAGAKNGHPTQQDLTAVFAPKSRRSGVSPLSVLETHDESLFILRGSSRGKPVAFYVDTSNPRFWVAHTVSKSELTDRAIEKILVNTSKLDSTWMPMELLERVLTLGSPRGLGLDFDRRYLNRSNIKKESGTRHSEGFNVEQIKPSPTHINGHLDYVKMQLWGTGADRILSALKNANLSHSTTISKVRLRSEDKEKQDEFTLADVKFDGKITGKGTSFAIYNGLLNDVLQYYSKAVIGAEQKFRLHWDADTRQGKLSGQPIYIQLGANNVTDLEHLCARLFSGTEPFRLMGLPIRRNSSLYTVSAVDLHVNQRVDFEVTKSTLSIFLPRKACGNTVLRLYTNLQHYFSSDVKAIDGAGSDIFTF